MALLVLPFALFFLQVSNEPKPATVEGTVTHAASKAAIRKAKINLTAIGFEGGGNIESADDGKFILKDVKPGRYRITAEKAGYETSAYGARRSGDALGQVLRIDPGAAVTGIDITLPKHGVIAGRILDSENEPVQRALVMALANIYYQQGRRGQIPRGAIPVISNDLGEYRIGQLPPGKYIVCAIPVNLYQPVPSEKASKPNTEDSPITTCFPNVEKMSESRQLEIRDASEVTGIDIRLTKTRTVSVQGNVTGVPPGAGTVTILNLNAKGVGPMGNAVHPRSLVQSADGRFEFKNVPPGSYILHTLPTGFGNAPFVVKAAVEVGDKPLTDLQVPALIPFSIKAKINAEPHPELKLGSVRIVLTPADEITSALAMGTPNADGELTLANIVPGRYRLAFAGLPSTHYLREFRSGEQIISDDEVDIPGASTQLSLSFALGKAEIAGVTLNDKGEAVAGAHVALIPEPRKPFRHRATRTDQTGAYRLLNLPAGEYHLIALDSVEAGALEDEEFVKPLLSKMQKVKVAEEGSQSVKLIIVSPAASQ